MKHTKKKFMLAAVMLTAPFFANNLVDTNYVLAEGKTSQEYKLVTKVSTYDTAHDAAAKTNKKITYQEGTYFIYKENNGMLNISKEKGKVGAWINPEENKKQEVPTSTYNNIKPIPTIKTSKSTEPVAEKIGWTKENNFWYYNDAKGQKLKNQWIDNKYYLKPNGQMAANEWINGFYLKADGTKATNEWIWDKTRKVYYFIGNDSKIRTNQWIDGLYYVKSDGKMASNEWIYDDNYKSYYYLENSGAFVKNKWIDNSYLKTDGKKAINEWIWDTTAQAYYFVDTNSKPLTNQWIEGKYYLKNNGQMAKNEWIYDNSYKSYYYVNANGIYVTNTWIGGYYLKADGQMAKNEWIYDNSYKSYYYLNADGIYVTNTWIGDYYLLADGKMAIDTWTPDGYFVDRNGKWVPNKEHIQLPFESKKYSITSDYGWRNVPEVGLYNHFHTGLDFITWNNRETIVATESGVVTYASFHKGGYGNTVIVKHKDGKYTYYSHLAPNSMVVKVGDTVNAGQKLGIMGTTGLSSGIHLHFGYSSSGNFERNNFINPRAYLHL